MFTDGSNFGEALGMGPHEAMPSLLGDFYNEPDNVTRGLSLYDAVDLSSQFGDSSQFGLGFCGEQGFWHHGDVHLVDKQFAGDIKDPWTAPANDCRAAPGVSRFQDGDEAPPTPDDDLWQFEKTSFEVTDASAAHIGNLMLEFFDTQVAALITKVNRRKFTIKVEARLDGLSCATKIRIYRQALGQYKVEMQRRRGDIIAFQRLYKWTSDHFRSCMNADGMSHPVVQSVHARDFLFVPSDVCDADSQASVAPLLDLAHIDNPPLQAEAVEGLLQAANDAHLAAQLCTPEAFSVLQNLLHIVCFSIVEPLARLLCTLARLPDAEGNFQNQQLLQCMIDKVWSDTATKAASEQLAQVVHHALTQHAAKLSPTTNRALSFALTEKLRDGAPYFAVEMSPSHHLETVNYLQESLHMLQACC